ncbi:MAG: GNAT family protein [Ignavibacteriota bacterium]
MILRPSNLTDDLELRQFEPQNAATLFETVEANRQHLRQWLPWVDRTRSADDIRQFLSRVAAQWEDDLCPQFRYLAAGNAGGCNRLSSVRSAESFLQPGLLDRGGHQGAGIVTGCCRLLMDYLFDEARLHRVEIRCATGNTRSGAIPRRLHFRREGILLEAEWVSDRWLDLEVWSMLEQDWRNLL